MRKQELEKRDQERKENMIKRQYEKQRQAQLEREKAEKKIEQARA